MIQMQEIRWLDANRRWLVTVICGAICLHAQGLYGAEIYKWVDGHGTAHYGERPPNKDAVKLTVTPKPSVGLRDQERFKRQERMLKVFEEERQEKAAAAQEKRLEKEKRKQNCLLARTRLFDYEHASMLYKKDGLGNRVVLEHNERGEAERGAREAVEQWCD
ncbi:MAG: DUF4124 domain-containing protein [Gammaproteobacteria bacterium]